MDPVHEEDLCEGDFEGVEDRVFEEPAESREPPVNQNGHVPQPIAGGIGLPDPEAAVIGACMMDAGAAEYAFQRLRAEHFGDEAARAFWIALQKVTPEGGTPDPVVLSEEVRASTDSRKAAFLAHALASAHLVANHELYVERVLERWVERVEAMAAAAFPAQETAEGRRFLLDRVIGARREVEAQKTPPKIECVLGGDLMDAQYPPLEWLVGNEECGLLYRGGITLLVANHKRGKSLAALGLALNGLVRRMVFPADDTPEFLGTPITGSGPVVYLSGEGGPRLVKMRAGRIEPYLDHGALQRGLAVVAQTLPRLDTDQGLRQVEEIVKRIGAVLVVIDPLSRFMDIKEEDKAWKGTEFYTRLRAWAERLNVAVLVVHHEKHHDADTKPHSRGGRGTSVSGNEVDFVVNLWPDDDGDAKVSRVVFAGRFGTPDTCKVRINKDSLLVEFVCRLGEGKTAKSASGAAVPEKSDLSLWEALPADGSWASLAVWQERVGMSRKGLSYRAQKLVAGGQIEEQKGLRGALEYRRIASKVANVANDGVRQIGG